METNNLNYKQKTMRRFIKKILILWLIMLPMIVWYTSANNLAPSYNDNFAEYFTKWQQNKDWEIIDVYVISGVSADKSLKDNIRCLFYPNIATVSGCGSDRGWALRNVLKYAWYMLVVIFIIIAWLRLVMTWLNSESVKPALMSLLYIIIWSLLLFWCIRILWHVLDFEHVRWTEWLAEKIHGDQSSLFFFFISFMKALAFFVAIFMMTVHWFKMMSNADKSEKVKAWLKWLLNVIVALVIIKMLDYIYYIVQLPQLVSRTTELIVEIAKIVWFIIWALMVIMLFYAGILYITDQWSGEKMKKATNIIIWILVSAVVIFALLLIIYEIFNEFA